MAVTGRTAAILNIVVLANTRSATGQLVALDRHLKGTTSRANATAAAVAGSAKRIGVAFAAVGGASLAAAAQFEDAFAEVRKTVDANEKQFKRIETGLRDMAKEIPVSVTQLSELAGEAGALGVKAKDIVGFTRVAADLGVATDLSAEQAADRKSVV